MTTQFGEVEILTKGENFPEGIVLREKEGNVVLLEQYFDDSGKNLDVLHTFLGKSLCDNADLEECLTIAGGYATYSEQRIYVVSMEGHIELGKLEQQVQQNKKICLECTVQLRLLRPWRFGQEPEKCKSCKKIKK